MIRAAIAGGTGYTAGELLRILTRHPEVEVTDVLSTTSAGKPVTSFHRDLLGETSLTFTGEAVVTVKLHIYGNLVVLSIESTCISPIIGIATNYALLVGSVVDVGNHLGVTAIVTGLHSLSKCV